MNTAGASEKEKQNKELERFEANSYEMRSILFTSLLQMEIETMKNRMEKRVRSIPGGWRDLCMLNAKASKLIEQIYRTMTTHQLLQLRRLIRDNDLRIQRRQTIPTRDSETVSIAFSDLSFLVSVAIDSQCGMCLRNRQEQKACDLRKKLMGICPPKEMPKNGNCPFMEAILDSTVGDYL